MLATVGLAAAAAHPASVAAQATSPKAQAWIEVANPTKQAVSFELSANGGSSFHELRLRANSSASYHVAHSASDFLIKFGEGPSTALPTASSKAGAPRYLVQTTHSIVTPVVPPPKATIQFGITNMTSSPSRPGGVSVTIDLSVDGGRTYRAYVVPYTGGLKPTPFNINAGSQGIIYNLPANPAIPPTRLTTFGTYLLFSNSNFQPYLFPSS